VDEAQAVRLNVLFPNMVSVLDLDIVADPIESTTTTTQGMINGQEPSKTFEPQTFRKHTRERQSLANVVTFVVDSFFEGDKEAHDAASCAAHSMKSPTAYRERGDSSEKHSRSRLASKDSIVMVEGAIFEFNQKED